MFSGVDNQEVMRQNKKCCLDYVPSHLIHMTVECQDLIFRLLEKDPTLRPTATEALEHPWFSADK